MPIKITHEEISERCSKIGFKLLEQFRGMKYKHKVLHEDCGYSWEVNLCNLPKLKGCPKCSGKMTWDKDRLVSFLEGTPYRAIEYFLPDKIKTDTKLYLHRIEDDIMVFTTIDHIKESINAKYRKTPLDDFNFNLMLLERGCTLLSSDRITDNLKCLVCDHEWSRNKNHVRWKYKKEAVPCPNCRKSFLMHGGFDVNAVGYLYYLRVETPQGNLYKIGITNRSVEDRFTKTDLTKITTLRCLGFERGQSAADLEKYYINLFKDFRYQGEPALSSGNTELFTTDILGLDQ